MPISLIPGVEVMGGMPPDPLQTFADHLQRAKEQQKAEARQGLDMMMQMTEKSGGRFVPDPKEVEKLAKKAGLPGLLTTSVSGGGGGAQDMFKGMAEHARSLGKAQEDTAAAQSEQAQHDKFVTHLETVAADPNSDDQTKAQAMAGLVISGKRTLNQALDAKVMDHLNPTQMEHVVQAREKELLGEPSETDISKMAFELTPKLIDDYDGDVGKAGQAANKIVRGETLPPELQPPMTDKKLTQEATIAQTAVELGWTPTMTAQAMAAKTTDVKKLGDLYGWNTETVSKLKPLKARMAAATEAQSEASLRGAKAQEREAGAAEQRVQIESRKEKADSIERVARAFKELAQASNSKDPELKTLNAQIDAVRKLQVIDKKAIPDSVKKPLVDQLMKSLTGPNGEPLMQEQDIPTFFGLSSAKGWVFAPPSDPEATKSETAPKGDDSKPLYSPDVLGQFTGDMLKTFGGAAKTAAIGNTKEILKPIYDLYQKDIGMPFEQFVNDYVKATPVRNGKVARHADGMG